METPSHCTVSRGFTGFDLLRTALLALGVVLVHGYHPWAEDGGLYVAGVQYTLNPTLFPHERAFVTEHLGYSVFAPAIAALVRLSHLSLASVLFCTYIFSVLFTLWAALRLVRRCFPSPRAHWTAAGLLAAWWTLPVAGTSLLLMDPYVTARSLSTPLSVLALSAALERWDASRGPAALTRSPSPHPAIVCAAALVIAALFHPLMAGYAFAAVIAVRLPRERRRLRVWVALGSVAIAGAGLLQFFAQPERPAVVAAAYSRYYWFLSQWHWFELLGLAGPLFVLWLLSRFSNSLSQSGRALCRAMIAVGLLASFIEVLYAHEHFRAHPIARLQPLRCFLLIYVAMVLLCGGALMDWTRRIAARRQPSFVNAAITGLPALFIIAMAMTMFFVQRQAFPASIHLELPGRSNPNRWVQAFVWVRNNTPPDALFALDARYINTEGEDAQTFRAIAQRSAIPDFSKDGGEAAITPRLAAEWQRAASATRDLSTFSDAERDQRLRVFGVDWMILRAGARTQHPCPYRNDVVKVCRL